MNSIPRKILAWLATLLGGLGTLVCLGAVVAVWIGAVQFGGMMSRAGTQIGQVTERAGERAEQATVRLEGSRKALSQLELRLSENLAKSAAGNELPPGTFDGLELRLQIFSQRLEDWRQIALAVKDFGDSTFELLGSFPVIMEGHEQKIADLQRTLGRVEALIGESSTALAEMQGLLVKAREGALGEQALEKFTPLFQRIDRALLKAIAQTGVFAKAVTAVGVVAQQSVERMRQTTTTVAILLTLLLLWQAAAQYCLARWGRTSR